MRKYFTRKNIVVGLLVFLVIIQVFQIDKTNPIVDPAADFIVVEQIDAETTGIIKKACYDCHSNQITYPWYTNIAPISWWIKHHINEGSGHLNFSEWASYKAKRKHHKMEEVLEMIEEREMPLDSYTWMHPEAKLSTVEYSALLAASKVVMARYADSLQATEK